MASNSEAEFKRHYTQVCHCEWSEDEFTRQTTSENCVMHGNVPDPLAALLAERQQDKERRKTLCLALECAADILGNAGYADDPDYANDWHQITAALAVEEDAPPQDELDPDTRAALVEMADEMREAERLGPPYVECGCGYPKQPCLRVMLRNGPPYPDRPCVPVRAAVEEDAE